MKSIEINVPKNVIILILLTLLSGVIVFDQIKIRKQEARLELMTEQMTNLLPETNYTQVGGLSQTPDQGLASGYQKIAESGQIPVNPFEQAALGQPPVDSIAKPFYEKPKITARTVVFNCDSVMESNKLLKKKVDYYFEYYRKNLPMDITIQPDIAIDSSMIGRITVDDTYRFIYHHDGVIDTIR
jgi:hypothetical protein